MTTLLLRKLTLRPGEEHRAVLDIDVDPFLLGGVEYVVATPVSAELVVQRTVSGNVMALRFEATVTGPCMRCLAPARLDVSVAADEYEADDAKAPEELRTEYVHDGQLAVSTWARDQIGISLPVQILCRPDCRGICAICGKDLNVEPHEHDEVGGDPRWAALEALREGKAD